MKPSFFTLVLAISAISVVVLLYVGELACKAESSSDPIPCCPNCGCHEGLMPVCHLHWTTKKETKYHYCCQCKPICIPDQSPCCSKPVCENVEGANSNCANEVDGCENGKCNCLIIAQRKLAKLAYTVETPVCKCEIEWVCPRCGCNCSNSLESDSTRGKVGASAPLPAPDKSASPNLIGPANRDIYSASDDGVSLRIPK